MKRKSEICFLVMMFGLCVSHIAPVFAQSNRLPTPIRLTQLDRGSITGGAGLSPVLPLSFGIPMVTPKWFNTHLAHGDGSLCAVRSNNFVEPLVDGPDTFQSMKAAIQTAGNNPNHFIYIAGWWLDYDFPLDGEHSSLTLKDLLNTADANGVEIRALLYDQKRRGKTQGIRQTFGINQLTNGTAIYDQHVLWNGSHHQKILIVNGNQGLIAFCGGVDFNADRLFAKGETYKGKIYNEDGDTEGAPFHDIHCKITGPATLDILNTFVERWQDNPEQNGIFNQYPRLRKSFSLRGGSLRTQQASSFATSHNCFVQIGRTYPNGTNHIWRNGPGDRVAAVRRFVYSSLSPSWELRNVLKGTDLLLHLTSAIPYKFAPRGEQTAKQMIHHAIRQAREYIYCEDQYMVDLETRDVLMEALPNIKKLIFLIPDSSITDLSVNAKVVQGANEAVFRRRRFIEPLIQKAPDKVVVYILKNPGSPKTYVHSKCWIFDDEYTIIGSANCNRRSYTNDSEIVAGIYGENVARDLRKKLWAEHLERLPSDPILARPETGYALWENPSPSAHIALYRYNQPDTFDPNGKGNTIYGPLLIGSNWWDGLIDPDGGPAEP